MTVDERIFRSVKEFESEMFPRAVQEREAEREFEHPSETGGRLAEEAVGSLRPHGAPTARDVSQ